MIEFNFETEFKLKESSKLKKWIANTIASEGFQLGDISYVFCDDAYLLKLNQDYLNHDTLTDIISFDYRMNKEINGEIYISVERVAENAKDFSIDFYTELHRVMIHGILHFCGFKDKTQSEEQKMRQREDEALKLLDLN
ncbi:rRNA maturation RNase YbeY [Vitellibacter sp. q18]|jgi:rRNA maturation RNase YbeY|nr:rRNA maturation RNase YbeY [Aequorivita lutea]